MGLLQNVKTLIDSKGTVYMNSLPDTPDNVIAVFRSGGGPRSLSGTMTETPSFQVRVRNTSAAAAEALADSIKDTLHGYHTAPFLLINQEGDILPLGQDDKERTEYTVNFTTIYRR